MTGWVEAIKEAESLIPVARTIITVIIIFIIFSFIISVIKRGLLKRVKRKRQVSNIEIFSRVLKYILVVILILFAFSSYSGSWAGFGIGVGLFSAALGWALQKPITGIAAWIMLITKRPFEIGDRVVIGDLKGDVVDISLTHVYLQEVGGIVAGEENSGRVILVPNSILFEQRIVNYTSQDEFVMDQVTVAITYESSLDDAIKMVLEVARNETKDFIRDVKTAPYVRAVFQPSGIDIRLRYFGPAKRIQEFSSNITQEISRRISKQKDVEIAYPHTEVVLREKKKSV